MKDSNNILSKSSLIYAFAALGMLMVNAPTFLVVVSLVLGALCPVLSFLHAVYEEHDDGEVRFLSFCGAITSLPALVLLSIILMLLDWVFSAIKKLKGGEHDNE